MHHPTSSDLLILSFTKFKCLLPIKILLEAAYPSIFTATESVYHAACQSFSCGVSDSTHRHNHTEWVKYNKLCTWVGVLVYLDKILDQILFLQLFAKKVRSSVLTARGHTVLKTKCLTLNPVIWTLFCCCRDL